MRKLTEEKFVQCWHSILKTSGCSELGYSADDLKNHIEKLWENGMSWDNYGTWQIEHIISLPKETHPLIVNTLANLHPVWADKQPVTTEKRPYTIFMDVDGCLVNHTGTLFGQIEGPVKLLPGVQEKFHEWDAKGYRIILTTGRKESMRALTEQQLASVGLFWDQLIMGIGGGARIIINDYKPSSTNPTAIAINLHRNTGLSDVNIEKSITTQQLALLLNNL